MIPRPPGSLTKRATQTKLKAGMTGLCESNRFQIMAGWGGEGHANHRGTMERGDWHLAHMNCILSRICLDSSF